MIRVCMGKKGELFALIDYVKTKKLLKKFKMTYLTIIYLFFVFVLLNLSESKQNFKYLNYLNKTEKNDFKISQLPVKNVLTHKYLTDKIRDEAIATLLMKYCHKYDVDLFLMYALIKTESDFNSSLIIKNQDGSFDLGLCQLNSNAYPYIKSHDLLDKEINIHNGILLLKKMADQTDHNLIKTLVAFKYGLEKIEKKQLGKENLDYIQAILNEKKFFQNEVSRFIGENYDLL